MDHSKLVCTMDDLAELKDFLNKADIVESCSREEVNAKWRYHKLINLTVSAASLEGIRVGSREAVSLKPLLKNQTVNCLCLTYDENTRHPRIDNLCPFRAPALHLHQNQRVAEKTSKNFNFVVYSKDSFSPNWFQGVHMNDIPAVEDLLTLGILLYYIDIVEGNVIG